MMKKFAFNMFLCGAVCMACMLFFSCEMFTTSLAKGTRRDPKEVLKNLSTSELIAFSQTTYTADSEILTATFELLGKKNKEELKTLSLKEKEQVLGLLPEAGFPVKNLKTIAAEAFQVGQSGATEQSDKAFVQKLITAVQLFDTEAASTLLSDGDVMKNTDEGKLATAAVTLMIRITAQVGHESIKNKVVAFLAAMSPPPAGIDFKTMSADDIVKAMLGAEGSPGAIGTPSNRTALTAAVSAIKLLSGDAAAEDSDGHPVGRTIEPATVKVGGRFPLNKLLKAFFS
jgi:lipoprotein